MRNYLKLIAMIVVAGFIALAITACEREEARPMVNITGDFTATPDVDCGYWMVALPTILVMEKPDEVEIAIWKEKEAGTSHNCAPFPKEFKLNGTCTFFDQVDPARSVVRYSNLVFDEEEGCFKGDINITLSDLQGNHLYMAGTVMNMPDLSNKAFLQFEGGTGKFVNAEGWMTAFGMVNPKTGVNVFTASGNVTAPKR